MKDHDGDSPLWRVILRAPYIHMAAYEALFEDEALAITLTEAESHHHPMEPAPVWFVQALMSAKPDRTIIAARAETLARDLGDAAPELIIEPVPAQDWVSLTNRLLTPIKAGRLTLYGGHDADRAPLGWRGLRLEAGQAFGTGRAPSTLGCLLAIDALTQPGRAGRGINRAIDVGTGSGVLAMALKRLRPRAKILATDIDPVAVRVTRDNLRVNGITGINCLTAAGVRDPRVGRDAPYDLVMANILSKPLMAMARDLSRLVSPHGRLLLSGLLTSEERTVTARFRNEGMKIERRVRIEGWSSLILSPAFTHTSSFKHRRKSEPNR